MFKMHSCKFLMNRSNAISVCFGDHLWFGKGDGQLKL